MSLGAPDRFGGPHCGSPITAGVGPRLSSVCLHVTTTQYNGADDCKSGVFEVIQLG